MSEAGHPSLKAYYTVWILLFVLSVVSYGVDFFGVHPEPLKWSVLVMLALAKAGLIMAVFMHLKYERLSLIYTLALPPILIAFIVIFGMGEGQFVAEMRRTAFGW